MRVRPTPTKHKAYVSLEHSKLKDEAGRLFKNYLNAFQAAPEADFLLKRYFFDDFYMKKYLQENTFFIPRLDFLWFFTYCLEKEREVLTITLKKRSASKDEMEIEEVTIRIRKYYKVEEGPADIIYTRSFEDGKGQTYTLKNTIGAVSLAEKLLVDFQDDRVTAHPY